VCGNSLHAIEIEKKASENFHAKGLPLLVSPQLLRARGLGQVDVARMIKQYGGWVIEVGEVKSSLVGSESMLRNQMNRLRNSQYFLSGLFGAPSRFIEIVGQLFVLQILLMFITLRV